MNPKNDKCDSSKEMLASETKNVMGKITGNEQLELRGKLQSAKALAGWGSTPLKRSIMRQL